MPSSILNWDQYGYDQKDVFLCMSTGIFSSVVLISSYLISKTFRTELNTVKRMVVLMSCLSLIHCVVGLDVYVDKPNWSCAVQAAVIQLFGVSSTMFQAPLSIEMYMALIQIINCIAPHVAAEAARLRLIYSSLFIFIFNLIAVLVIILGEYYGPTNDKNIDFICYVELSHKEIGLLFAVLPFLVMVVIIVFFTGLTIWQLSHVIADLSAAGSTEDGEQKNAMLHALGRFDERGKLIVMRLITLPCLYVGAGVVEVIYNSLYYNSSNEVPAVIAYCLTAGGPVFNCLVWVVTDRLVLMDWVRFLSCRLAPESKHADDDFAGPESVYEPGGHSFSFAHSVSVVGGGMRDTKSQRQEAIQQHSMRLSESRSSNDASILGNLFLRQSFLTMNHGLLPGMHSSVGFGDSSSGAIADTDGSIGYHEKRQSEISMGPISTVSAVQGQNPLHRS